MLLVDHETCNKCNLAHCFIHICQLKFPFRFRILSGNFLLCSAIVHKNGFKQSYDLRQTEQNLW